MRLKTIRAEISLILYSFYLVPLLLNIFFCIVSDHSSQLQILKVDKFFFDIHGDNINYILTITSETAFDTLV